MKILTVVGARPNFMKVAPIIEAINKHNEALSNSPGGIPSDSLDHIEHLLVHTGQHYDSLLSVVFFVELKLPKPDVHLGVGAGSPVVQTAEMMKGLEDVLQKEQPDVVIVVGDVNSTVAATMATVKTSFHHADKRPLIAHVEAGLRSFDRSMPEELNRIVTDHLSDIFFVTEESGVKNLSSEGIPSNRIHLVGNTMIDSLLTFREKAESSSILEKLRLLDHGRSNGKSYSIQPYAVLTLHRPSNVDDPESLRKILRGLEELAPQCPIVFPAHPRTQKRVEEFGMKSEFGLTWSDDVTRANTKGTIRTGMILTEPLGYLDFLCLMKQAALVITDSGGIQEETTFLGIPCVTVRDNTERPVTIEKGTNFLAGTEVVGIKEAIRRQWMKRADHPTVPEKWDGHAAERIVSTLVRVRRENQALRNSVAPEVGLAASAR
ncbi:MAG: UDP-N-acetylglucosamine 2-epimerase (non-hydrolyzing) [Acidobacteria bacterium]|nr:UDP-N-acetylglucosamine 2-epimerase (non-hydrolyzing) [Acidobacteriota bacterium]